MHRTELSSHIKVCTREDNVNKTDDDYVNRTDVLKQLFSFISELISFYKHFIPT